MSTSKNNISPEKQTEIAKFLELPSPDGIMVTESTTTESGNELHMVHYRSDADKKIYGQVRGTVIDLKRKQIISRPFGYSPKVIASRLLPNKTGDIQFQDEDGSFHKLMNGKFSILPHFEGVTVQVFLYEGKVYHSTLKRLDFSNSKWGDSPTFGDLWKSLKAPADEKLFDLSKKYSPYCHLFLLVHPSLLYVTKEWVGAGYTVYLGPKQVWDPKTSPYPQEQIDKVLHRPEISNILDPKRSTPVLYSPVPMSINQSRLDTLRTLRTGTRSS